jgi:UDP-N-acetylglucosamine 4,6-dehydratase
MNVILVTGGSGFLGRHLIKKLIKKFPDTEVRAISRSENAIKRMLVECRSDHLVPIVGDIRDSNSLKYALRDADMVIHLAAMKHIDLCEMHPVEAITINVIGTKNILDLFSGSTFIGISTDKCVEATTCYGATKLLAEKLILERAKKEGGESRFMVIRAGNIFGSSGSVIEKWKQEIRQTNEISITDPEMTRFFINVNTLVDFILEIMDRGENGNTYIPFQKTIKLSDLAQSTIDLYGNKDTKLKICGPRTGEKLHELLFADGESVISDLDSNRSQNSPRLDMASIKAWLEE